MDYYRGDLAVSLNHAHGAGPDMQNRTVIAHIPDGFEHLHLPCGEDRRQAAGFPLRVVERATVGETQHIDAMPQIAQEGAGLQGGSLGSVGHEIGQDAEDAQVAVDSLADWVDSDDMVSPNGAEKPYYEKLGRLNQPFNRPFYNLDEVRLVRGMDMVERLRPDWRDWFTVWSTGLLDVNEARAELISVAADVSVEDAQKVVEAVMGPDQVRDTEDDARFQNIDEVLAILGVPAMMQPIVRPRLTVNDTTTRIESIGRAGVSRQRVVLIVRNRTGQPAILEKFEEPIP